MLLYHLIQPVLNRIQQTEREEITKENQYMRVEILIYFVFLMLVQFADTLYSVHYPLDAITKSIQDSKVLVHLMPELQKKIGKNGYMKI